MNCSDALERMLEADLAEVEGSGSELGLHVRGCERCRASAQRILAAERELGQMLTQAAPRRGIETAVRRAQRRTRRRRWAWRAVPLAAAATLAALVVTRGRDDRMPSPTVAYRPVPSLGVGVAVQAPAGHSVAVFKTDNPDIVVIWFFD